MDQLLGSIAANAAMFIVATGFVLWALECKLSHIQIYAAHIWAIRNRHPNYRRLFYFAAVLAAYCVLGCVTILTVMVLADVGAASGWWRLFAPIGILAMVVPAGAIAAIVFLKGTNYDDPEFKQIDRETCNELRVRLGRKPRAHRDAFPEQGG